MYDEDTKNIVKYNLLISLPVWLHSVENTLIFKNLAEAFIEYLTGFSAESREKLMFVKSNFEHFYENDSFLISAKKIHEENIVLKEKEKKMKILYEKHLFYESESSKSN